MSVKSVGNAALPDIVTPDASDQVTTLRQSFENGEYPCDTKMGWSEYEAMNAKLQIWAQETGQKFVLLFEGRDAAGRGGTIKRFTEHFYRRAARVVALNKPTYIKRDQWVFSAISSICRRRVRSCCMIFRDMIAPVPGGGLRALVRAGGLG